MAKNLQFAFTSFVFSNVKKISFFFNNKLICQVPFLTYFRNCKKDILQDVGPTVGRRPGPKKENLPPFSSKFRSKSQCLWTQIFNNYHLPLMLRERSLEAIWDLVEKSIGMYERTHFYPSIDPIILTDAFHNKTK